MENGGFAEGGKVLIKRARMHPRRGGIWGAIKVNLISKGALRRDYRRSLSFLQGLRLGLRVGRGWEGWRFGFRSQFPADLGNLVPRGKTPGRKGGECGYGERLTVDPRRDPKEERTWGSKQDRPEKQQKDGQPSYRDGEKRGGKRADTQLYKENLRTHGALFFTNRLDL